MASTVALAAWMLLAGCGGTESGSGPTTPTSSALKPLTLVLDYEPNAVHAGLLRAAQAGYFERAGIALKIVAPSSTSDALTQVSRGKADLGLADLIDVARRNERAIQGGVGAPDAVSLVSAIVQRPLSGLLVDAASGITTPDQLRGKRIAVSGLPSDEAVVAAIVRSAGKPLPVKTITLGFNGLKALDAGRVDASTAYWPADEVTLERLGTKPRTFALDEFGGPAYPGLVAFSNQRLQTESPVYAQAFAEALAHGTRDVIADPAVGLAAVQDRFAELDAGITKAQLERYTPLFGTAQTATKINPTGLKRFITFAAESGLTSRRLTPQELVGIPAATELEGTQAP